jgi:hypothetical protein
MEGTPKADFTLALLGGKVLKRSLPVLQGVPAVGAPPLDLKRLLLPQGELAQFHDGGDAMRYIAFVELRPGTVRGNHYHDVKKEWFYVVLGELSLIVEDIATRARESVPLRTGDLVVIEAGVAHALVVAAPGQGIEFSPACFNPADTHRFPLV